MGLYSLVRTVETRNVDILYIRTYKSSSRRSGVLARGNVVSTALVMCIKSCFFHFVAFCFGFHEFVHTNKTSFAAFWLDKRKSLFMCCKSRCGWRCLLGFPTLSLFAVVFNYLCVLYFYRYLQIRYCLDFYELNLINLIFFILLTHPSVLQFSIRLIYKKNSKFLYNCKGPKRSSSR